MTELAEAVTPTRAYSQRELVARNTGYQGLAQVVALGTSVATAMLLSRYLGVEGFGQLNYIFAFFYFFLLANDFGVAVIVVREACQDPDRAGEIIGTMCCFKALTATVSMLIAWVVIWLVGYPADLQRALAVYALFLPVLALQLPGVIFQVRLKFFHPMVIGIANRVLGFLMLVAGVLLGGGLSALVVALLVAEVCNLILLLRVSGRFVTPVFRIDTVLWRRILRSSVPLGFTGLCVAMTNRLGFLLLERMTSLREVGYYAAAYRITAVLEMFPLLVMSTVYPLMVQYAARDRRALRALYGKCLLGFMAIGVPIGIGVTVCAPAIVGFLFGAAYADAVPALRVLVWSTVFLYVAITGGNLLIAVGRETVNLGANIVGAAANVILNLLLIPRLGLVGAALATTIGYFLILVGIVGGSYLAVNGKPLTAREGATVGV